MNKRKIKKAARQESARKRKNFLPTLLLTMLFWLLLVVIVFLVDPEVFGAKILFFIILFLALLFSFSILLGNKRWGLIISTSLTFFAVLRSFGVGNALNLILISGVAVVAEIYFSRK